MAAVDAAARRARVAARGRRGRRREPQLTAPDRALGAARARRGGARVVPRAQHRRAHAAGRMRVSLPPRGRRPAALRGAARRRTSLRRPARAGVLQHDRRSARAADRRRSRRCSPSTSIRPVEFVREIEAMYDDGARIFVEVGPRSVLTGLVPQILGEREHLAVPDGPAGPLGPALAAALPRRARRRGRAGAHRAPLQWTSRRACRSARQRPYRRDARRRLAGRRRPCLARRHAAHAGERQFPSPIQRSRVT